LVKSPGLKSLLSNVKKIVPIHVNFLISCETGTGKELIALPFEKTACVVVIRLYAERLSFWFFRYLENLNSLILDRFQKPKTCPLKVALRMSSIAWMQEVV